VYAVALEHLVEPAVRRYEPDFVLVSLGFDAFWADPLASLRLSLGGAYTPLLASAFGLAAALCGGRLVVALEGGYDLGALAHGTQAACHVLLGEAPPPDPLGAAPDQLPLAEVRPILSSIRALHNLG
jgi:acetoin utilization deacetylase AcuC-like enzyme